MRFPLAFALMGAGAVLIAQSPTSTISLEILPDGTCSIAVRGAGARSEMSYLPRTPGRCPIPATRAAGAVRLEVRLPPGTPVPRASVPSLRWTVVGDRPRGVADLNEAPAFVDIMPPTRRRWARVMVGILLGAAAAAAAWSLRRDWFRGRHA